MLPDAVDISLQTRWLSRRKAREPQSDLPSRVCTALRDKASETDARIPALYGFPLPWPPGVLRDARMILMRLR